MKLIDNAPIPQQPYPELRDVLNEFVAAIQAELADNLEGFYLVGSLASGDFDLDSDVDFLVVTRRELTETAVRALQAIQTQIHEIDCYPAKHLEGSYISLNDLNDWSTVGEKKLYYFDNGSTEVEQSIHDNQWHVRWILRERGITLLGPEPKTLLPPIPADKLSAEIKTAMRQIVKSFAEEIDGPHSFLNSRFGQSFAVLTCCRMLHTLHTGTVQSKKAAVAWARQFVEPEWIKIIDQAWEERKGVRFGVKIGQRAEQNALDETAAFMKYAVTKMENKAMTMTRLYLDETDLEAMIGLMKTVRPAGRLADFPGVADLHGLLARPAIRQCTRLWHDNGRLTAFAFVNTTYRNLYFEMSPDVNEEAIGQQIVNWGLTCLENAGYKPPLTLDTSCRDDDNGRLALLRHHGFILQTMRTLHMARSLHEPIAAPDLPPGFTIRPLAGEVEVEARVALHRAAFGTENMTVEDYLAEMHAPEYDPTLDLVAVDGNGRLAAFCTCSIHAEENEITGRRDGYTDPVGTHPDFQRQGLARALLLAGMRLLQARGMETAVLGTSSQNIAMQKTAASVGFTTQWSKIWLEKPLVH